MMDLREIEWAISQLEQQESSWTACAKLADLYAIRNQMQGDRPAMAAAPQKSQLPDCQALQPGQSDFLQAVSGKPAQDAWAVMDELMQTLEAIQPRVYTSVMRKIQGI